MVYLPPYIFTRAHRAGLFTLIHWYCIWGILLFGFHSSLVFADSIENSSNSKARIVYYPGSDSNYNNDSRNHFYIELLKKALNASGEQYQVKELGRGFSATRQFQLIQRGDLSVAWNFSDPERDPSFRQIPFPIDRGLMGWRLLLVRDNQQAAFSEITQISELAHLRCGQGQAWQDTKILQHNELSVSPTPSYEGLFKMLQTGHIDYLPRSILEIYSELNNHQHLNLAIDKHLMIYYPTAFYYFVNKENAELANAIERGLQTLYARGEFDKLFWQYHGDSITQANIKNRKILKLNNPFLSDENRNNLYRYWLPLPP